MYDAIKTMIVRGAPAIGIAGAHGVVLAAIESKEKAKDLLIPNVGFVHLSGDNLRVKLYIDKKIKVILEDSFI